VWALRAYRALGVWCLLLLREAWIIAGVTDVAVLRAAFATEGVSNADAIGWRALVMAKKTTSKVQWIKVYGAWIKYCSAYVAGIAQGE